MQHAIRYAQEVGHIIIIFREVSLLTKRENSTCPLRSAHAWTCLESGHAHPNAPYPHDDVSFEIYDWPIFFIHSFTRTKHLAACSLQLSLAGGTECRSRTEGDGLIILHTLSPSTSGHASWMSFVSPTGPVFVLHRWTHRLCSIPTAPVA